MTLSTQTHMENLISVIIPVHNAGAYLHECLDSVLGQTHSALQVIAVDDGSTDNSAAILASYASLDRRVEVIHLQAHSGVSEARNAGIRRVTGDWLAFVDADDAIAPHALESLLKTAQRGQADAAVGEYMRVDALPSYRPTSPGRTKVSLMSGESAMVKCLHQTGGLDSAVWGKLYAASLFDEKMRFRDTRFEDLDIIYRIYDRCHRVCRLHATVYYYRRHDSSFIGDVHSPGRFDVIDVCASMLHYTQLYSRRVKRAAYARTLAASMNVLGILWANKLVEPELEQKCLEYLKFYRGTVIITKGARRRDRLGALAAYLPVPLLRRLLRRHGKKRV